MTVTLTDVVHLLGLVVDGESVIGVTYTSCKAVCARFLGKAPDLRHTSGGMVKLSWLKETFSLCPEDAPIEDIECHTRAYLLYLVGSTIFSTTTGNKVPVMYLPLFENFDQAGNYAWGAAALSFLYRALGNASLKSQSTISGCLTLLQCWSYYHLNVGRPKLNHDPIHDCFPFVLKWKGKQSGPTANRDVAFYRKALDALKSSDVEWRPYTNNNHTIIPEEIKNNLILGTSKTMLICFDKAERHLPDRCLRQYGMQQTIPEDVPQWERKSRGVDGGVDLSGKMESELNEWSDRRLHMVEGDDDVDESEYMQWYLRITRKLVGRPIPISSEFQRMNAALRDIAHLADTLSTHGMDEEQIYSVTRIRYIVHECLRDQVGSSIIVVANTQNELGKRVRGKERVRRKGAGKRKRTGEDAQFCDEAIELDAIEVDHSQLCHVDSEIEHSQLCLPGPEGDDAQLCHSVGLVDDPQLCVANEVDVSHFEDAADEDDHSQLSHAASECRSQQSHADIEVVPQSSLETGKEVAQQNDYGVLV